MKSHLLFIVFDSCRFDSFAAAKTPFISRLGKTERRYSFASWTLPSHHAYMMGMSPHKSPRGVFASEVYKKDFLLWADRLNIPGVAFKNFLPHFSLPKFLQDQGYVTNALVSMPVLNQLTVLNKHFDRYELMDEFNDFSAIIDKLEFGAKPTFHLLNIGETHYPYTIAGEKVADQELLHGPKGVFVHSGDEIVADSGGNNPEAYFHLDRLEALRKKQISNVEHLDSLFEKLYDKVPKGTHIIVTADHGELFGEEGFFGHGPILHEKVLEVFFVEGRHE